MDSVRVLRLRTREDHQPDESLGQRVGGEVQLIHQRSHFKTRIVRRSRMTTEVPLPTHWHRGLCDYWSSSSSIITINTITTNTNITVTIICKVAIVMAIKRPSNYNSCSRPIDDISNRSWVSPLLAFVNLKCYQMIFFNRADYILYC